MLSFLCVWDDRANPHGDLRKLRLNYHLEDDSIEILEPVHANSGREPCMTIIARQRVPWEGRQRPFSNSSQFDHVNRDASQQLTFGVKMDTGFMNSSDLGIGKTVRIHGKDFFLYDCTAKTREYYQAEKGYDLDPSIDIDQHFSIRMKRPPRPVPPPHDGIGSEEDSLGNWQNLLLKVPKKDHAKWVSGSGKVLKFVLQMVPSPNATIEEQGRAFTLSYFLEDDTLQLDEIGVKNSGIVGGKYLLRQKVRRVLTSGQSVYFRPHDFQLGAVVSIYSKQFKVVGLDIHTEKLLAGIEDPTTVDGIKSMVVQLKEVLAQRHPRLQLAFRAITTNGNNYIDMNELIEYFKTMNVNISPEDTKTIIGMYDTNNDGMLDFKEFVCMMNGDESSNSMLAMTNTVHTINLSPEQQYSQASRYQNDVLQQAAARNCHTKRSRILLRQLRDKLHQRRIDTVDLFRLMDVASPDSVMCRKDFEEGVRHILHLLLQQEEMDILCEAFFSGGQRCTLENFTNVLEGVGEFLPGTTL
eukprot:NODE_406_length_1794_cov_91.065330_g340_i0.p1 GENE.NODE_406_length_1794_cov_91.065330_g340_i0~~NODE_406_length_1794_cov_91.065330_g340_i0.p1  ORF type:complete len:566 (-),score=165.09 NODE_406_length_1794_cov_91.065330_g340_i0:97-1668(-)